MAAKKRSASALTIRLTNGQKEKINEYYKQEGKKKVNLCNFIEVLATDFVAEYNKAKRNGQEELLQLDLLRYNIPRKPAGVQILERHEKGATTHLCLLDTEMDAFKEMSFKLGFTTADLIRRLVDRKLDAKIEEEYRRWEAKQKARERTDKELIEGQITIDDFNIEEDN